MPYRWIEEMNVMTKVLVIFGGRSSEYEVACRSAAYVTDQIDREKYEVHTVGVTKEGRWLYTTAATEQMADYSWEQLESNRPCVLRPIRLCTVCSLQTVSRCPLMWHFP